VDDLAHHEGTISPAPIGASLILQDMNNTASYFGTRFRPDTHREVLWQHLARYLERFLPADGHVVEIGAGYASWINHVRARSRVAIDLNTDLPHNVGPGVKAIVGDVRVELEALAPGSVDAVLASNFFEHFEWPDLDMMLARVRRCLRVGGRLVLVQPNFRLAPRRYFDDYTHRTIFTDVSLRDWLEANGLVVVHCQPRFMPLTVKSRLGRFTWLVPWYLRLPFRPLAGQMLMVAERPPAATDQPSSSA
jgi:hypothetical protein